MKLDNGYLGEKYSVVSEIWKTELYAYKAIVFDMVVREGFKVCLSSHGSNFLLQGFSVVLRGENVKDKQCRASRNVRASASGSGYSRSVRIDVVQLAIV